MKKNVKIIMLSLSTVAATGYLTFTVVHAAKSDKVIKETIILKEAKNNSKSDGLKSFGTGVLGGFIGGALGSSISQADRSQEVKIAGRTTDRERRLIESYAQLEDDYNTLYRETIRIKRRVTAFEAETAALRANNTDLKQDLETSRLKKKKYKEIAIKQRGELERLKAELATYKPEGPATVPHSTTMP